MFCYKSIIGSVHKAWSVSPSSKRATAFEITHFRTDSVPEKKSQSASAIRRTYVLPVPPAPMITSTRCSCLILCTSSRFRSLFVAQTNNICSCKRCAIERNALTALTLMRPVSGMAKRPLWTNWQATYMTIVSEGVTVGICVVNDCNCFTLPTLAMNYPAL